MALLLTHCMMWHQRPAHTVRAKVGDAVRLQSDLAAAKQDTLSDIMAADRAQEQHKAAVAACTANIGQLQQLLIDEKRKSERLELELKAALSEGADTRALLAKMNESFRSLEASSAPLHPTAPTVAPPSPHPSIVNVFESSPPTSGNSRGNCGGLRPGAGGDGDIQVQDQIVDRDQHMDPFGTIERARTTNKADKGE